MPIDIDAHEFLATIRPALAENDLQRVAQQLRRRWQPADIQPLLENEDPDVRAAAASALGLIGDLLVTPALNTALRDRELTVNQAAENALWSIWFRSGNAGSATPFQQGMMHLAAEQYQRAVTCFEQACTLDPTFAEAYNQCAIAHYLLGQWDQAITHCQRTIERIPAHFGAILGMGHCHAQKGDIDQAFACYRHALQINPHMPAIAAAICDLQHKRSAAAAHVAATSN